MSDDTAKIEMPEYTCHKKVHGLKIAEIVRVDPGETGPLGDRSGLMVPEDTRYGAIPFDTAFSDKHNPQIGDYYVVYKDGYKSISPEEAFESGYTMVEVTKHGPEKEPPTYQERVSDEKAELDDKRMKLIAFTNTETFRHLNSHDQMLMRHQADKMRGYSSVLNARIDRFIRP